MTTTPKTTSLKLPSEDYDRGWAAGYEQCKVDNKYPLDLLRVMNQFMCTVNLVTSYHRHGGKIPKRYLDNLANTQLDIEEMLATFN